MWMQSVRRDHALSMTARAIADYLATEKANRRTQLCNPSYREIAAVFGVSVDTVKRAIRDLIEAEWLCILEAGKPGQSAQYGFLSEAKITRLHGGKNAPIDGGKNAPKQGVSMGANLHTYGGKNAFVHNKDKPRNKQRVAQEASGLSGVACLWVNAIRNGQFVPANAISGKVQREIIQSGLLTQAQMAAHGITG